MSEPGPRSKADVTETIKESKQLNRLSARGFAQGSFSLRLNPSETPPSPLPSIPRPPMSSLVWFRAALLSCCLVAAFPKAFAATPESPPNLIFLLVDDLGTDWIGAYGSRHPTPHIDRLAARGVRFETAWTSPICTPSRVMLLTGQYPGRTGWIEHYDVPRWGGAGLIADRFPTWPQMLKRQGYATAIAGKWQINDLRLSPDVLQDHGFDRHCVWPGVESNNAPTARRYWDAYLQIDGNRKIHRGEYGPDITQSFALDFIRQNRAKPFLLYYPMILVHDPNEPTPLNRGQPPSGEDALYAGSVTYMDRQVGELLDELERLDLTGRTIVVFTGDNGSSSSGVLAGRPTPAGKGKTTQWGVRVPLIVSAPMISKEARVTESLTDFTDLYPSILELAGIASTPSNDREGRSWVPLLRGARDYVGREWIFAQRNASRTVRDRQFKLDSDGRFFDLIADPDELSPLILSADDPRRKNRGRLAAALASIPAASSTMPFPEYSPERMREYTEKNAAERGGKKGGRKAGKAE